MSFTTNKKGIALLESLEGCKLKAYKLKGEKYYTIGYGHSWDKSINANTSITQAQAEAYLKSDLKKFEGYVNSVAVKKFPSLNENQFSALVCYTYNRGLGKSNGSSGLYQLVMHSSSIAELGKNITVYWGSAIKYKKALIERRQREQVLFNTACGTPTPTPSIPAPAPVKSSSTFNQDLHDLQWAINQDKIASLSEDGKWGNNSNNACKKIFIKKGSYGHVVAWVQCRVGASIDMKAGQNTADKIMEYQRNKGLTQDGKCGYNTIISLLRDCGVKC